MFQYDDFTIRKHGPDSDSSDPKTSYRFHHVVVSVTAPSWLVFVSIVAVYEGKTENNSEPEKQPTKT